MNQAYEALVLLKVGESFPKDINCSLPNFKIFPEVGLTLLFKLLREALANTLINVFSDGQEPLLYV